MRLIIAIAVLVATLTLGGCGTPIWQEAYRPSPLLGPGVLEPSEAALQNAQVTIRDVPWDRVEGALMELEQEEAASDVHISEWDEAKRQAAVAGLLTALQLPDEHASTEILGWSSFATTDAMRVDTGVRAQARRVGADTVIWSSRVIGVGTRVVDRPVHLHRHGWGSYYDRHDGVWRSAWDSGWETAWVPVVIEVERVAYIAFFLRRGV